jgi:hypothetical protein
LSSSVGCTIRYPISTKSEPLPPENKTVKLAKFLTGSPSTHTHCGPGSTWALLPTTNVTVADPLPLDGSIEDPCVSRKLQLTFGGAVMVKGN